MFSKLGLFACNRAAQQSARYYGSRASSEAFNESVAQFKDILLQRYQGRYPIIEKDGKHWVQTYSGSFNLDAAAKNQALAALPKKPLPYAGKGIKQILAETPEEAAEVVDSIMKTPGSGY